METVRKCGEWFFNGLLFWARLGGFEMADEKTLVKVVKERPLWQTILMGAAGATIGGLTVAFLLKSRER